MMASLLSTSHENINMQNRRDFLRTSVAGAAGTLIALPAAVQKALAIEANSQTARSRTSSTS